MHDLESLVDRLKESEIKCELWVDGSFVTEKIEPNDVDVAVIVANEVWESLTQEQESLLDSLEGLKKNGGSLCDVLVGDTDLREAYTQTFGVSRGEELKGIVSINLPSEALPACL